MEKTGSRKTYLDIIRIVACFFVIVNHTNSTIFLSAQPSAVWWGSIVYFFLSKTAVPMFLMVSGAVLLYKSDSYKKAISRCLRILAAALVFSFIYFIWRVISNDETFDIRGFIKTVWSGNVTDSYWYLYFYAALMLMVPIMQKLVKVFTQKDYLYFIVISLVFLGAVPIVTHYFPSLSYNTAFILPLFSGYLGLLLLGHFVEFDAELNRKHAVIAAAVLVLCTALSAVLTFFEYQKTPESYLFFDNRLFITITAPAAALFILIKYFFGSIKFSEKSAKVISFVGKKTFGIYLLSPVFIELLEPLYTQAAAIISRPGAMIVYEILVFASSFIVSSVLGMIPIIKKLI